MDSILPKEFNAPCLSSLPGRVAILMLVQRLAFAAAKKKHFPSALDEFQEGWMPSPLSKVPGIQLYRKML